jgi:hypothetical protein
MLQTLLLKFYIIVSAFRFGSEDYQLRLVGWFGQVKRAVQRIKSFNTIIVGWFGFYKRNIDHCNC